MHIRVLSSCFFFFFFTRLFRITIVARAREHHCTRQLLAARHYLSRAAPCPRIPRAATIGTQSQHYNNHAYISRSSVRPANNIMTYRCRDKNNTCDDTEYSFASASILKIIGSSQYVMVSRFKMLMKKYLITQNTWMFRHGKQHTAGCTTLRFLTYYRHHNVSKHWFQNLSCERCTKKKSFEWIFRTLKSLFELIGWKNLEKFQVVRESEKEKTKITSHKTHSLSLV